MNTYTNKDDCYFRLISFYTACFLFSKGLELVNIEADPTNPKRSQFVFKDAPEREILIQNYNFAKEDSPEILIDARKFTLAIKTLKDKLYQTNY
jgi:hypothetical protein